MTGNRLYKSEKLCGTTTIDTLFKAGDSAYSYPLRAKFLLSDAADGESSARFLISVPKKKLRHAVDRVKMRRRIREAYRLNRQHLLPALSSAGKSVDIAFLYLSDNLKEYAPIEEKMIAILQRIASIAATPQDLPE